MYYILLPDDGFWPKLIETLTHLHNNTPDVCIKFYIFERIFNIYTQYLCVVSFLFYIDLCWLPIFTLFIQDLCLRITVCIYI